jgi:hypothetical protein
MRERILGAPAPEPEPATALFVGEGGRGQLAVTVVPLTDLTDLARLGAAMRRAQFAYFDARRKQPHVRQHALEKAARDAGRRFDAAVRDALNRERASLPGCE